MLKRKAHVRRLDDALLFRHAAAAHAFEHDLLVAAGGLVRGGAAERFAESGRAAAVRVDALPVRS
jgi:hypothetical protein